MSFDYVSDLFGKFRKGKRTRFTELEENANHCYVSLSMGN